ncbi:MAG TPA: hypothetical protein VFU31_28140 [Candidatus Binatia bacterium]|nr:hypothetical protein [Candidatus Binatia bacterium]
MAQKTRRKISWAKILVFLVLVPVLAWAVALVLWFSSIATHKKDPKVSPKPAGKVDPSLAEKPAGEKIREEERRRLEAILKEKTR